MVCLGPLSHADWHLSGWNVLDMLDWVRRFPRLWYGMSQAVVSCRLTSLWLKCPGHARLGQKIPQTAIWYVSGCCLMQTHISLAEMSWTCQTGSEDSPDCDMVCLALVAITPLRYIKSSKGLQLWSDIVPQVGLDVLSKTNRKTFV
jgi:hypothetical protein